MGFDVSAQLIVGVRLEKRSRASTVVRYDPITGDPFVKQITEEVWCIRDSEIVVDLEEYDDPQPDDLKLSWADHNNHDTYFLGMHLAGTESYRSGWVEVPDVVDSIARLDKRVYFQLVGILGALDSSNRRQQLRDCIKIYLLTHLS